MRYDRHVRVLCFLSVRGCLLSPHVWVSLRMRRKLSLSSGLEDPVFFFPSFSSPPRQLSPLYPLPNRCSQKRVEKCVRMSPMGWREWSWVPAVLSIPLPRIPSLLFPLNTNTTHTPHTCGRSVALSALPWDCVACQQCVSRFLLVCCLLVFARESVRTEPCAPGDPFFAETQTN